jgi:hypothetical protein
VCDVVLLYYTPFAPYPGTGNQARERTLSLRKARKPGKFCSSAHLPPTPVPVVVETINPTAFSPLSCGSFAYHPRLGHRVRPWTLSSPTSLVVDIKESTTHAANLVVLPSRLTLHQPLRVLVCLQLFGCLLAICVVSLPPPTFILLL